MTQPPPASKKNLELTGSSRSSLFLDASKERGEDTFSKIDAKELFIVKKAFIAALDKLRHQLPYDPISLSSSSSSSLTSQPEVEKAKKLFGYHVRLLHSEVFTAAGYIPWLERNFTGQQEVTEFSANTQVGNDAATDIRIKDLVLREVIWLVAEQIRHCPNRINELFYQYRRSHLQWYNQNNNFVQWFLVNKYTDITVASANLPPPKLELSVIHGGIQQFVDGKLNFDDIDDCSKWKEGQFFKTFFELPGATLFFVMLKYNAGMILFKLWTVAFLFFLYKFGKPLPGPTDLIGNDKYYTFPALRGFVMLDYLLLVILTLNEWVLRLIMTRQRRFQNLTGWLILRFFLWLSQPILGAIGFVVVYFAFATPDQTVGTVVDKMALFYLAGRLGLSVIPEFFPYSPMVDTSNKATKKKAFWSWKGLRKRYIARLAFMAILTGVSMVYEFGLIIPAFDTLFKTSYCGDASFNFKISMLPGASTISVGSTTSSGIDTFMGINSQHLICYFSTAFMWFVTVLAILIDNGLAFITVMAFVGWIRGFKTQGTARATIQIELNELYKRLEHRFIKNISKENVPTPKVPSTTSPKKGERGPRSIASNRASLINSSSTLGSSINSKSDLIQIQVEDKPQVGLLIPVTSTLNSTPPTAGTPTSPSTTGILKALSAGSPQEDLLSSSPLLPSITLTNATATLANSSASVPTPTITTTTMAATTTTTASATSSAPSATPSTTTTTTTTTATTATTTTTTTTPTPVPAPNHGKELWNWAVDYYRGLDLISDKEREYLKTSPMLDMALLGSPDAQKHISFFVNTLDVLPVYNYSFHHIPPTTIIIPCFSERLEFDWVPQKNYSPFAEFSHLVAKYPHEWLNLIERLKREKRFELEANQLDELEVYIQNTDMTKADQNIVRPITDWLTFHDQYLERTIRGACSYYDALVQLGIREGLSEPQARIASKEKLQVILCMQIYPRRHKEVAVTLARWMKELPSLCVVFDYEKADNMPEEFTTNIPNHVQFATCMLQFDPNAGKVVYKHVIPRTGRLLLVDVNQRRIQGKSMNQLNGMTFLYGRFIQVLDANQGGHAPEYLKFPSLLRDFRLHPQTGDVRYRIIGSREYIFTKNLGTVARCHAYQEWSFGTLVLRTYSDLGIRLHYGHPDVFHGPWAYAHSGLSKVNPDINTSEDVFAGFGTLQCHENTKHVEHIQFHKGRETGLAAMSSFDTKISQGNSGILRSRDMYHLMERLDFVTGFLLFQGVSGHFTTISLMMWSMKLYIMCIFLVTLSGASLKAFGNISYATEWLFHAGLTTIIPLVVEFLVEYGPIIGLLRTLIFLPASTMIYLFQMQTKHAAFLKGILTGKASHIDTGRGLAIYRTPLTELFKNYANTHIFPMFFVIAMTIAYKTQSNDLGGGTLPLIMIYFLCVSVIVVPQLFNPAINGNALRECSVEFVNFLSWIGKSETRRFYENWATPQEQKKENSFLTYWVSADYENLPSTKPECVRSIIYHIVTGLFWFTVFVFLTYPLMQFWVVFYLCFWWLNTVIYCVIFYILKAYEAPLRIILIYIGCGAGMSYYFITLGDYGVLNFSEMYIAFLLFVKLLENWRSLVCDLVVLVSYLRKQNSTDTAAKQKEERDKYIGFMLHVVNKLFLVNFARVGMALVWGLVCFIIALLLRPYIANLFLFGDNVNSKAFGYLKPLRKLRARQAKFGINV